MLREKDDLMFARMDSITPSTLRLCSGHASLRITHRERIFKYLTSISRARPAVSSEILMKEEAKSKDASALRSVEFCKIGI